MIPVGSTPLCSSRGLPLLGVALAVAFSFCALAEAGPVGVRTMRQAGDREPTTATPTVSIQVIAPATAAAGKDMTYRIVVENTSDAAAHHVLVKATLSRSAKVVRRTPAVEVTSPEGAPPEKATVVTWKIGTLAAGGKREQRLVVTPTGDEITCCARVQFEHGQCVRTRIRKADPLPPAPPDKTDLAPVAPIPPPPPAPPTVAPPALAARPKEATVEKDRQPPALAALRLRQTPTVSAVTPGETITYVYEVTNVGTAPAKGVVVEATPGENIKFLSSKPSTPGDIPVTWKFEKIAPGATERVEYSVSSVKLGTHINKAIVKADGGLRQEVEHTVRVGQPKLVVAVIGPSQRGTLRDATYRITVKNVGDFPAHGVELSDAPIKHGKVKDDKVSKPSIEDGKISDAISRLRPSDGGTIEENVARWSLRDLTPGAEQTVSIVLQAKAAGNLTYNCVVRARGGVIEQGRTTTQFVEPLPLEIDLQRIAPTGKAKIGAEVAYTLRLRNGGATENTNVVVIVSVPDGLEVVEVKTNTSSRPNGREFHLPTVQRLTAAYGVATLRFRAIKPGDAKLSVKAVSGQMEPDKPARAEEIVTVGE